MAALEGFERNHSLILIAGGDSKGADLTPLGAAMEGRVRALFTLGMDAQRINDIAQHHGVAWRQVDTMDQAVDAGVACARAGDTLAIYRRVPAWICMTTLRSEAITLRPR